MFIKSAKQLAKFIGVLRQLRWIIIFCGALYNFRKACGMERQLLFMRVSKQSGVHQTARDGACFFKKAIHTRKRVQQIRSGKTFKTQCLFFIKHNHFVWVILEHSKLQSRKRERMRGVCYFPCAPLRMAFFGFFRRGLNNFVAHIFIQNYTAGAGRHSTLRQAHKFISDMRHFLRESGKRERMK